MTINNVQEQDTMHAIESLKNQFLTEENIQEYIKQQDKLIWVEWLIDAKSLNETVHQIEQAFFELTDKQERTT